MSTEALATRPPIVDHPAALIGRLDARGRGVARVDGEVLDPKIGLVIRAVRDLLARLMPPYPQRVVYVSCNTETLARDAGVLVAEKGYELVSAGVVDMFPHTTHSETTMLFEASSTRKSCRPARC